MTLKKMNKFFPSQTFLRKSGQRGGGGKGMFCRFKAEGSTHEKFEFLEKRGFLGLGCFLELCVFLRKYHKGYMFNTEKSTTISARVRVVNDYVDFMSA